MDGTTRLAETSSAQQQAVVAFPPVVGGEEATIGLAASLIQVAGWALVDIDVRDPSAELLEPMALALFSLGVVPARKERPQE